MAKLELPVQAFMTDFCRRAFPNRDWHRGSAIRDLMTPMAALLQPFRHELDGVKVNLSLMNYPYMSREDLDALAANWGRFRQSGGRSYGTVRLYLDRAADFNFTYLEFEATDGTVFVLSAPVKISTRELIGNRLSDGRFYYDVAVQSVGIGNRYALSAGTVTTLRQGPPEIVSVDNPSDFQVTAPDESNFDLVNAMFRGLGMRNLVSPVSIRTPLYENFPGVLDIFVAGADHANMARDLRTLTIDGRQVDVHLGGATDVWVNTTSVAVREVLLAYLPTSKEIRIVSADQAQEDALLFVFSQLLIDVDGRYSPQEYDAPSLDESAVVQVLQAGVPYEASVIDPLRNGRYAIADTTVVSGDNLMSLPARGNDAGQEALLTDVFGINWNNTPVAAGQILQRGNQFYRILDVQGRVARVAPETDVTATLTYSDNNGAYTVNGGDRYIPLVLGSDVRLNDRAVIGAGPAQGHYRVLGIDGGGIAVGRPRAQVRATFETTESGVNTYTIAAPDGGTAEIPEDLDELHWLAFAGDGGYDQAAEWARVVAVTRSLATLQIQTNGGPTAGPYEVTVVGGLNGPLENNTPIYFERPNADEFTRSTTQPFDTCHTRYCSVLSTAAASGTNELTALGLGEVAAIGDLLLFDAPASIPQEKLPATGGDGSKFTVMIDAVLSPDVVRIRPALPAALPINLRFSLIRNDAPLATLVADDVATNQVTFADWPLGLGDGYGMGIKATQTFATQAVSACDSAVGATWVALTGAPDLSEVLPGDSLTVSGTGGAVDGIHTIFEIDEDAYKVRVPGNLSGIGGTAVVSGKRLRVITSSTAGDLRTLHFQPSQIAIELTFQATGYTTVSPNEIGAAVRQTVGGVTHAGILHAVDNAARKWTIIPNDPTVDTFVTSTTAGEEVKVVNGSAQGYCTLIGGQFSVAYYEPDVSDIGKIVRQGSYTGILDSYSGGTADPYWQIKPLSEHDRFDRTDILTYVDRDGTGQAPANAAHGTLSEPASLPEVNGGSVVVTLDAAAPFATGAQLEILSRFGRHGGMISNGLFRVLSEASFNGTVFTGVDPDTDALVVLNGDSHDIYDLAGKDTYYLELQTGSAIGEFVRIANAPPARRLTLSAPTEAGETTLTAPGSRMGLWGHDGRVLLLTVNNTTYHLAISGPVSNDAVELRDPIPVALYPEQTIEYEIVEGFHLPYFVVPKANLDSYRIFEAPDVNETIYSGTQGFHTSSPGSSELFVDPETDFLTMLGYSDWNPQDQNLVLFIDEGPEASVDPYPIVGLSDANTLILGHTWTSDAGPVTYHISRRNAAINSEEWLYATIEGPDTLRIEKTTGPAAGWDMLRFNTYRSWQLGVYAAPGTPNGHDTPVEMPVLSISAFDASTQLLTVDLAASAVAEAEDAGLFDTTPGATTRGFQPGAVGTRVRLALSQTDRVATRRSPGTVSATYNYYANNRYFVLPLVRIQSVELLDPESLQPTRTLPYRLQVNDKGLRYSPLEDNSLVITEDGDDAVFQPVRISYLSDPSIEQIHQYLNEDDTRVVNGNSMAKRMETIAVNVSVSVRSTKTTTSLIDTIAQYINNLPSTTRISKDGIIQYLYKQDVVSFVDTDTLVLSARYFTYDGQEIAYEDSSDVFGADTACYLANVITVTLIDGP